MKNDIFKSEILNLDNLFGLEDLQQVKDLMNCKPIHPIECFVFLLEKERYRDLFEFAVENEESLFNKDELALAIMNKNYKLATDIVFSDLSKCDNFDYTNKEYFDEKEIKTLDDIVEFRKNFILEMANYFNKKRICGGLNREYFLSLLDKSSDQPELLENLKIKLTKKLEQVLQNDYDCKQETLQEKINNFDENYNINFNDYDMKSILHKLRISSNDIRHQQIKGDDLSIDELKLCIDYICHIDKDDDFEMDDLGNDVDDDYIDDYASDWFNALDDD